MPACIISLDLSLRYRCAVSPARASESEIVKYER